MDQRALDDINRQAEAEAGNSLAASSKEENPACPLVATEKADEYLTAVEGMEQKLKTAEGRETYAKRGKTVEARLRPVEGRERIRTLHEAGLRGLQGRVEPDVFDPTNLLKLWRFETAPAKTG